MVLGACAIVVVGVVVSSSSIGAQTATPVIEPVSVDASDMLPVGRFNGSPAVSDAGAVVAFDAADLDDRSDRRVWIRDRTAGTTTPVAEERSSAPGISGNGCLVAYSVPGVDGVGRPTTSLTVVDRCSSPSSGSPRSGAVIDSIAALGHDSAPALSFDGSTIVWSTGSQIRRYERPVADPASGVVAPADHLLVSAFDSALIPTPDIVTGADLDVSDDGTTVVYVAGPGVAPFAPDPGNVYVWSLPEDAVTPTIDLLSPTATGELGDASSGSPTMSGDGSLVFFDSSNRNLAALGAAPVAAGVVDPLAVGIDPVSFVVYVDRVGMGTRVLVDDASRPAVSADGMHVVYERAGAIRLVSSTAGATYATTQDRAVEGLENANPVTGSSLSQFGRWIVFDSADGTSLTDDVEFHDGVDVWAADQRPSDDGMVVDTTTTTTTTTTTDPEVEVLPPTATTVPPTTLPPYYPSYPTTRPGSSGSSGSNTVVASPPLVVPGTVTFEPTIVAAGRRTATASLSNPSTRTATVVAARVDSGDGAFSLVTDGCTGVSLPAGSSCTVDVQFAPLTVGAASGLLVFDLADGTAASAALVGDGSAQPTLDVVPAVAAPGQVVTVFGAGFPAGVVVEFSRSTVPDVDQVIVDPDGTFAHVFVVLPNTSSGPMALTVAAQPDSFGDVTGELLVSNRSAGSNTAVFRDIGSPTRR